MAEHRTLNLGFFEDDDVVALSHVAFRVLVNLRGVLPASGLGEIRMWDFTARCRCSLEELENALTELASLKPSGEPGWIRREGRLVWIVNALRHTPIDPRRDRNGRLFIQRLVSEAKPCALVDAFRAAYPLFFDAGTPDASVEGRGSEGGPEGVERGSGQTVDGNGRPSAAKSGAGEPEEPKNTDPPLSALSLREQFMGRYYAAATPERRQDVEQQLDALLSPAGCRISAREVARASAAELEAAISATMAPGAVRDDGKAIVVLLRKVRRVPAPLGPSAPPTRRGGITPIGQVLHPKRSPVPESDAEMQAAVAWIECLPELRAEIERQVDEESERSHPRWREMPRLASVRARNVDIAILLAFRSRTTAPTYQPLTG